MRNRFWTIILLIVWVSQWGVNLTGPLPMESMSWREGWLLVEDMAPTLPKERIILINLSGRGDKDLDTVMGEFSY